MSWDVPWSSGTSHNEKRVSQKQKVLEWALLTVYFVRVNVNHVLEDALHFGKLILVACDEYYE
jgi:hypothetical protein